MIQTARIGFLLSLLVCLFSQFCLQSHRGLEEIVYANQVFLFLFHHWWFIIYTKWSEQGFDLVFFFLQVLSVMLLCFFFSLLSPWLLKNGGK